METDERLPDLMRRATETLEPRSPDLVERGIRRGLVRRRRRRVVGAVAAAAAVAMTIGGITVLQAGFGVQGSPPVAGTPTSAATPEAKRSVPPRKPNPPTPAGTLQTLRELVPGGLPTSGGKTWGDDFIAAGLLVDDGHGKAWVEMGIETVKYDPDCTNVPSTQHCTVQPDGTFLRRYTGRGNRYNAVVLEYPDRRAISLTSTNGQSLEGPATRAEPPLSIDQLVAMAYSKAWSFPAANYGKNLNR